MAKIQIHYWAGFRGLAERVRLLAEYLGLDYEFVGYTHGSDEWAKVKESLADKNPLINLPFVKDGDKIVAESEAVLVYLCQKAGRPELLGRSAEEAVAMTTVRGAFQDAFTSMFGPLFGDWEAEKAKLEESVTARLAKFDAFLGTKEYLAGEITYIDFVVFDGVNIFDLMFEGRVLKGCPNLAAWYKRMDGLDRVKAYKASGRYQERPVLPKSAKWH